MDGSYQQVEKNEVLQREQQIQNVQCQSNFTESQSRKSVQFSEEEEEIPNYETQARKAARKAVKKEALKGCGETKIEVVIRHYFLSVTTDRFLLEISQVSGFCFY